MVKIVNSKRYIVFIVFACVFGLNLILNYKLKKQKELVQYKHYQIEYWQNQAEIYRYNTMLSYQFQNLLVPNYNVYDIENRRYYLKRLIKHKTLIVRYNEFACLQCVDSFFTCLDKTSIENCIIIGKFRTLASSSEFFRVNQPQYEVYSCFDNILPIDTLNVPYTIVLDSNLTASSFFIPQKNDVKQMDEYLNIIDNKIKLPDK